MKPGPYRLTRDMTNPHAQPRVKKDWTKQDEDIDSLFERLGVDAYDLTEFLKFLVENRVLSAKEFEQHFARWNQE